MNFLSWICDFASDGSATYGNLVALCALFASFIALVFVIIAARGVLRNPEGDGDMPKISAFIRSGANAFLKRQYSVCAIFFAAMFVVLGLLASLGFQSWFMPFAFMTGGCLSGLSGFIGMKIATAANARTAQACKGSLNSGLRVAFSAGTVMGLTVVGLGLFDISSWFLILKLLTEKSNI